MLKYQITNIDNYVLSEYVSLLPYSVHGVHLTPSWIINYLQSFKKHKDGIVFQAREYGNEKLVGAILLEKSPFRGTRFWNLIRLIPFGTGPSDFYDILTCPGYEERVARTFVSFLKKNYLKWDEIQIGLIPTSSPINRSLVNAFEEENLFPITEESRKFYFVNTTEDWDSYESSYLLSKNADLRKDMRKVFRAGIKLRLETVKKGIDKYLPNIFKLYSSRREKKDQINTFASPVWQDFLKNIIIEFEPLGMVELSLLVDSRENIWAYQLDWIYKNIRYHYSTAFDEQYSKYSPGKILLYEILKQSFFDPNIRECNFMRGESSYKRSFANLSESYFSMSLKNPYSFRRKATSLAAKVALFRDRFLKSSL